MKNFVFAISALFFVSSIGFSCQDNPVAIVPPSHELPKSPEQHINQIALTADSILARALVSLDSSGRMAHFLQKCKNETEVSIAFLGGSITGGAAATLPSLRYSSSFCTQLRSAFPKLSVNEINAGIGATNSRFGCSRLRYDVLAHQPDLIVIEYAVNDDPAEPTSLKRSFEGLVRQSLSYHPDVAVIILLFCANYADNTTQLMHTAIARHYGLPVVSYRDAIWPLIQSNQIPWDSVAADVWHPNDRGHKVCATYLYESLRAHDALLNGSIGRKLALPLPLHAQPYSDARLFFHNDTCLTIQTNEGWVQIPQERWILNCASKSYTVAGFSSDSLDEQITFTFVGTELSLGYYKSKNLTSMVEVSLNGLVIDTLRSYFENDWGPGYMKMHTLIDENQDRVQVTLRNITGGNFEVMSLMYAL